MEELGLVLRTASCITGQFMYSFRGLCLLSLWCGRAGLENQVRISGSAVFLVVRAQVVREGHLELLPVFSEFAFRWQAVSGSRGITVVAGLWPVSICPLMTTMVISTVAQITEDVSLVNIIGHCRGSFDVSLRYLLFSGTSRVGRRTIRHHTVPSCWAPSSRHETKGSRTGISLIPSSGIPQSISPWAHPLWSQWAPYLRSSSRHASAGYVTRHRTAASEVEIAYHSEVHQFFAVNPLVVFFAHRSSPQYVYNSTPVCDCSPLTLGVLYSPCRLS